MSDVETLQWNKERNSGFMSRAYGLFKQGLPRSAQKFCSYVSSMTRAAGGEHTIGYDKIGKKLNMSKSSLSHSAKLLGDDFDRKRTANACTTYIFTGERPKSVGLHVHTDFFLYTQKFYGELKIKGKYVEVERTLTDCEVDVYSYILSLTNSKNGGLDSKPRDIAKNLHINEFTVRRAINNLIAFELIFRPQKGVNKKSASSRYVANMKIYRRLKKKHTASVPEKEEMERRRRAYYQAQSNQRTALAERYKKAVYREVPRFREVMEAYDRINGKIEITQANVELGRASSETLQALLAKRSALRSEIRTLAENNEIKTTAGRRKINLNRFDPKYYGGKQCEKCHGTGELPDGGKCDCWLHVQT